MDATDEFSLIVALDKRCLFKRGHHLADDDDEERISEKLLQIDTHLKLLNFGPTNMNFGQTM